MNNSLSHFSCCLSNFVYLFVAAAAFVSFTAIAVDVGYDGRALIIGGERKIILSGSIHYPRSTPEMWPDLIQKAKDGGLNAIETYVFWDAHEPRRREYDFTGKNDLVRFLKEIQTAGLYAILRIGPYVCAEWNYGGFPVWLHNIPNIKFRTNNDNFKNEMATFTTYIVNLARQEQLFASQGGPIIIAQIENEYGNIMGPYGNEGKEYIKWSAQMAVSQKIAEPWIMCQQSDAPEPMINTCNGYYCHEFKPNRNNVPKMWTENWVGWYKKWGEQDPHRTAEDIAYAVARFFQTGGALQNYYMYHGGTNFGRTSGGPYIATSYDYDAPLDEYGNLNQPKWGHLKQLHEVLFSIEKTIVNGNIRQLGDLGQANKITATMYTYEGNSSCFIANVDPSSDVNITFQAKQYKIPAWSVSILPDCKNEVYNTAKISNQVLVFAKETSKEDDQESLNWEWVGEDLQYINVGDKSGDFRYNRLIDQKEINDTSDYLWYITSVVLGGQNDPLLGAQVTLRVKTTGGHVIHAYVNGKYVATHWGGAATFSYVFEPRINLSEGPNKIALLHATVGYGNYGAFYDEGPYGITGSVQLVAEKDNDSITKDLSQNEWIYKAGLYGEEKNFYDDTTTIKDSNHEWHTENLPIDRRFTWYKTSFKSPHGTNPVVVDLKGMGKGQAWVNGQSIGRYWPTFLAPQTGCDAVCNYRGVYKPEKCRTNCGSPTQRWYHVPRSFLESNDRSNTLVLFEELGGNPSSVNFQTVTVQETHALTSEGQSLELSCQGGKPISEIRFASLGDPQDTGGSFKKVTCESPNALSTITKACVGKSRCTISVSESILGKTGCYAGVDRKLAVQAIC